MNLATRGNIISIKELWYVKWNLAEYTDCLLKNYSGQTYFSGNCVHRPIKINNPNYNMKISQLNFAVPNETKIKRKNQPNKQTIQLVKLPKLPNQ